MPSLVCGYELIHRFIVVIISRRAIIAADRIAIVVTWMKFAKVQDWPGECHSIITYYPSVQRYVYSICL